MWNIANLLTYLRIILIAPICYGVVVGTALWLWVVLGLYLIACISDFLDGFLARKYKLVSDIGTFLDPIADKILIGCLLVTLAYAGHFTIIGLIAALVIMTREFLVSGLREFLGPLNVKLPVTKLAKWKTTIQMAALIALIPAPILPDNILIVGEILLLCAAALTLWTGIGYIRTGFKHLG